MKKALLLLILPFYAIILFAQNGTIETITAQQEVDMVWYGNYDATASFPDGTKSYRQVLMHYDMGCASSQCSDWDYTTRILLMENLGYQDSTVQSLDTISTSPWVVDTTWNVFDVMQPWTLGEVITPYGGYMAQGSNGFNNAWKRRHTFDVTDYLPLMKNDVLIRAFYDGWSEGFSVSVTFEFVEGTPSREVKEIHNYYNGGLSYSNSTDVEGNMLAPADYTFGTDVSQVKARIGKTGHGADDSGNCAEFCPKYYQVMANATSVAGNVYVWRNDCGSVATYPQGGTWLYSREGWCPGGKGSLREFELTSYMTLPGTNTFDLNLQSVSWTGGQPYYYIDAHLVGYGTYNFMNDASITDIIAPSGGDDHSRYNPFCGKPIIEVKNMGGSVINSIDFKYGLDINGWTYCEHSWTGTIGLEETVQIELPTPGFDWVDLSDPKFFAEVVNVNGVADEYIWDNRMETNIELVDVHPVGSANFELLTNNRASETSYIVTDADGNVIQQENGLSNSTTYTIPLDMSPGCYKIRINDNGPPQLGSGDGVSHWVSTQYLGATQGAVRLRSSAGAILKTFNPDFGNFMEYHFVVGNGYGAVASTCSLVDNEEIISDGDIRIFPNPTSGILQVELAEEMTLPMDYEVLSVEGKMILHGRFTNANPSLDLGEYANGMYFIRIKTEKGEKTEMIVLNR